MRPLPALTGLILAGGQARRMGGQDKGLLAFQGQTLLEHVLQTLQAQVQQVLINANRNTEHYARLAPVVADAPDLPEAAGPLLGVASGLRASPTPWLLCVPCDSPWAPPELATRLWEALLQHTRPARPEDLEPHQAHTPHQAGEPHQLQQPHQRLHPQVATVRAGGRRQGVFLLLNRDCLPALETWLQGGGRKVDEWLDLMQAAEAEWQDATPFSNFNTPEDLARAAQRNQESKA